ncbi:MAG: peptide chain release factor N(5)-glutamine methyltransferase [Coriobacteriia bacterium]|nr:peptide chain release factor N(5)-glutamine methyltransferase [Coriobacteriia bacterium]
MPSKQDVWTIKAALDFSVEYLSKHADEHPRLSAEWLIADATGLSRVEVYTQFDKPMLAEELAHLREALKRRAKGEPLQYVSGETAFRHIIVKAEPGVLIPRPETEMLVEYALERMDATFGKDAEYKVLEIGTGTGCIACSIAKEREGVEVIATDISPHAVALARKNRDALHLQERLEIVHTNMADKLEEDGASPFDLLISNPPYIPKSELALLPSEVADFEPLLALDGGEDGLDFLRALADLGTRILKPEGLFACELYETKLEEAALILEEHYSDIDILKDLVGRNRFIFARLK